MTEPGATDDALPVIDLIRIGASSGRAAETTCPASLASKSRPRSRPIMRWPKEQWDGFVLRPVMHALDRIEFDGIAPEQAITDIALPEPPMHPGVICYAEHATRSYLAAHHHDTARMKPVREFWVAQRVTDSAVWELYAWGRRYESLDGRVREFRFLRQGTAGTERDESTAIAIAAYVAAFGLPAAWPNPWSEPFRPEGKSTAEQVRVRSVGLADGGTETLFDGTTAEAEQYFAAHGRNRIGAIAAGDSDLLPGFGCLDCKRVGSCHGPTRAPGLLGLDSARGALRTISVSGLRYYQRCAAQAYLRSVHLPTSYEYSGEAELGQAVHAWLEQAHMSTPQACDSRPLPALGSGWSAGNWQVKGELADAGVRMLAQHAEVCPFHNAPDITHVRPEPQVTVFDPQARAIVLAKPDLVYQEAGAWVWREVKTTQKAPARLTGDPLRVFPQLALGIVVLADGVLGPEEAGRVELEILRPEGAEIVLIDPSDPERVTTARTVLRDMATSWRADHRFDAQPGRHCQWCPVSQWCPSSPDLSPDGKDHDHGAEPAHDYST